MLRRRLPGLIAHADWGTEIGKRWMSIGRLVGDSYQLSAPERVGEVSSLLQRLRQMAGGTPVVVGFDFPIGLPAAYAIGAGIDGFLGTLASLGRGKWSRFYEVAVTPAEIAFGRPFYPFRPGGTSHSQLTGALAVSGIRDLLRQCELATTRRGDACSLFWTLGGKQVGRGAIVGWRDVLAPAMKERPQQVALWPFHGPLDQLLLERQCVVVETYPAESCLHLGITPPGRGWSKKNQTDRRTQGNVLLSWGARRGVTLRKDLVLEIHDGFGPKKAGEDPFDATLGLMSMVEVILGHRPECPPVTPSMRELEGWIFGQGESATAV